MIHPTMLGIGVKVIAGAAGTAVCWLSGAARALACPRGVKDVRYECEVCYQRA